MPNVLIRVTSSRLRRRAMARIYDQAGVQIGTQHGHLSGGMLDIVTDGLDAGSYTALVSWTEMRAQRRRRFSFEVTQALALPL